MSTKISINYQNRDYTLEYSRQSVKQLEQSGFVLDELATKPMSMIPMLFYGAFAKNHRGIKRTLVEEIFDHINENKMGEDDSLVNTLMEMYVETMQTLSDSKVIDEKNAATWKVVK